jgi:DNA mismatch endonuclease, patch repair protein
VADVVRPEVRSRMMSGIRSRNTRPELKVRRHLHSAGLRFRLHSTRLPGKPDIVLPRHRALVLVHGCFWHQHAGCAKAVMPKSNAEFWKTKLEGNRARDVRRKIELEALGWRVFVVWECSLEVAELDLLIDEIRRE